MLRLGLFFIMCNASMIFNCVVLCDLSIILKFSVFRGCVVLVQCSLIVDRGLFLSVFPVRAEMPKCLDIRQCNCLVVQPI